MIDETLLFNRVLSTNELRSLYEARAISQSFNGLSSGDHVFTAISANTLGEIGETEERTVSIGGCEDIDGDGLRDPSYSHPTDTFIGGVSSILTYNPLDLMTGANFTIFNNMTENIPWARAAITLPKISGYVWNVTTPDTIIRTQFQNSTHVFYDVRINALKKSGTIPTATIIELMPILE